MNKAYFKYLFKTTKKANSILLIVNFLLYPLMVALSRVNNGSNDGISFTKSDSAKLGFATTALVIMAYIIPVVYHKTFQKKEAIDSFWSLPIKKNKILVTKIIYGALQMIAIWSITFIFGVVLSYIKGMNFNLTYFALYYLLMIVISICIYLFSWFVCTTATTVLDSVILNGIWIVIMFLFQALVNKALKLSILSDTGFSNQLMLIILSTIYCKDGLVPFEHIERMPSIFWISLAVSIAISCVAFILSVKNTKDSKAEDAEGPSKNIFGYRLAVPFITLLYFTILNYFDSISDFPSMVIVLILGFLAFFTLTFIGKRKIKFSGKLVLLFIGIVIVGNALGYLINII